MEFRLSEINDIVYSKDNDSQRSENNVTTSLLVPSCSSHRPGLFNNERMEQVNLLLPHATEATVMNRGSMVNANVAHDRCNGGGEIVQPDLLCEKSNVEIDSSSNDKVEHNDIARGSSSCERLLVEADAMNNIQNIDSKNKCTIARLEKDYGITREILEQHFGKTLVDAAKTLHGKFTLVHIFEDCISFHVIKTCSFLVYLNLFTIRDSNSVKFDQHSRKLYFHHINMKKL